MEVFTDIRMNLAVTWVKISYTGQTEGYNEFRFSLPIPTDSVLSNLTMLAQNEVDVIIVLVIQY